MVRGPAQECDRTRAWISAELDGEVSEFEAVLLHGHLSLCDSCSAFKAETAAFAAALRSAPFEALSRPVTVSRRRRIAFQPLRVPAVAALAISMIGFGGLFASLHSGAILRDSTPSAVAAIDDTDMRQLQLAKPHAAAAQLRARRAAIQIPRHRIQISRHTGFQNP